MNAWFQTHKSNLVFPPVTHVPDFMTTPANCRDLFQGRKGKGNRLKSSILPKYFNESAYKNMLKSLLRDRKLLLLLFLAIAIKLFSLNEAFVEQYYTYGIYPWISRVLRS